MLLEPATREGCVVSRVPAEDQEDLLGDLPGKPGQEPNEDGIQFWIGGPDLKQLGARIDRALEALARYCLRNPVSLTRLGHQPHCPRESNLLSLPPIMTSYDYHMVMKSVGVAELKSHLSEHLRNVRRGEVVTVLDRSTPVARLVPVSGPGEPLVTRPPRPGAGAPGRVPLPPRLTPLVDVVALLLEERQGDR
ncbi:MAG TPA: type II toxin-antitoxin system prevent-host-death family antitoxin [Thermoanaerobaculia bacterium]|nr:type II toxin-antitoxin system prevent-host-death family antitoxin [Thermoanaerobaculia bacterium]